MRLRRMMADCSVPVDGKLLKVLFNGISVLTALRCVVDRRELWKALWGALGAKMLRRPNLVWSGRCRTRGLLMIGGTYSYKVNKKVISRQIIGALPPPAIKLLEKHISHTPKVYAYSAVSSLCLTAVDSGRR